MDANIDALFSLSGKTAIVTGAAKGSGKAIAEGLLKFGAIVYFVDILEEVESVAASTGSEKASALRCDVSDKNALTQLISEVTARSKTIDILVNNAGISCSANEPYSGEIWDKTLAVNLKAVFLLSSMVAKIMMKQAKGSIINITSISAELGFPDNPSYAASKGGLRQLTKAMACDWAQFNIRVNNVCPGYVKTDMTRKSYNQSNLREERSSRIMLQRWGEPSDLIGACVFLASDASAYITGIDLPVDGGWLAKGL